MTNKLYIYLSAIIIALALFLRLYKIENRAPFDWDQNRDYEVVSQIASGKPVLIGPVAKGEGGFFLGPLYYYLATPLFVMLNQDPVALPYTSAILDVFAIAFLLVYLRKFFGSKPTLFIAFLWSCSWFAIESSRVSWNVALMQIWVLSFIYLILDKSTLVRSLLFGLVLGLSWHVHASLIPLSLIVAVFFVKYKKYTFQDFIFIALGYLLAISPLILFDFRHSGLQRHLIVEFFSAHETVSYPFIKVFESLFSRFGKNNIAILTASSDLHFWWGMLFSLLALLQLKSKYYLPKIASVIVLVNIALTLYLGEIGFPEYYLSASYLPILIVLTYSLMPIRRYFPLLPVFALLYFSYLNFRVYTTDPTTFSLLQKSSLASAIAKLGKVADVSYDLPFGRESGINVMLKREGVKVQSDSKLQVVITESTADSIFIDAEIAQDVGRFGGFRLGYRVVQ